VVRSSVATTSLHDDARRGPACGARGDRSPGVAADIDVVPRVNTVRVGVDNRSSFFRSLPERGIQRNLAQKWNPAPFGLRPRAAVAEYRRDMIASRTTKARHIFDQPEQRYVHLLEHGD